MHRYDLSDDQISNFEECQMVGVMEEYLEVEIDHISFQNIIWVQGMCTARPCFARRHWSE